MLVFLHGVVPKYDLTYKIDKVNPSKKFKIQASTNWLTFLDVSVVNDIIKEI